MMIEKTYPEPTVSALIFNHENHILLIKSHKWKGHYVTPGGHVELGERIEDALRREVTEETGLMIDQIRFLCFSEFIFDDSFYKKKHFICFAYACKTNSQNVILNDEGQAFVWVSLDDALKLPLQGSTRRAIEEYRKGLKTNC